MDSQRILVEWNLHLLHQLVKKVSTSGNCKPDENDVENTCSKSQETL